MVEISADKMARVLLRTSFPKEVVSIHLPGNGDFEGVIVKSPRGDIVVTKTFIATTRDDGLHLDVILPRE